MLYVALVSLILYEAEVSLELLGWRVLNARDLVIVEDTHPHHLRRGVGFISLSCELFASVKCERCP